MESHCGRITTSFNSGSLITHYAIWAAQKCPSYPSLPTLPHNTSKLSPIYMGWYVLCPAQEVVREFPSFQGTHHFGLSVLDQIREGRKDD